MTLRANRFARMSRNFWLDHGFAYLDSGALLSYGSKLERRFGPMPVGPTGASVLFHAELGPFTFCRTRSFTSYQLHKPLCLHACLVKIHSLVLTWTLGF